jgi:alpha-amylase/alpha-mannosidase (GH57 family)
MERYICIHGHFYQPPRENAWLEYVEWQNSAYPYHDWNERVTAECYLPNTSSRILDKDGYIARIVNNYAKISFDFGPTLLTWLEDNNPDVYQAVLKADKQSIKNFSGHGSAMAQAYNHLIMPLANHRDRYSQVVWGIKDFNHRFGREPEGMWLPETAVDLETLDIMAELGIKFTVLSPYQAAKARRSNSQNWRDVTGGAIDPTRAYAVNLPSGRKISVFFYDGPISADVSFKDLLKNGDAFAGRLTGAFSEKRNHAQLVNIATDGETYGHHHRFGDMALAYAIRDIESGGVAKMTNYGEFLEKYPPECEVKIIEKSSWSCTHGVDRWWSDDGCTTGAGSHPDWNQKWRTPLRNAMDFLRDTLAPRYEEKASQLLKDSWDARNGYIDVILKRHEDSVAEFFKKYAGRELSLEEQVTALKLLELQRHAMLMYTSCGWFFDELSRPEPVQVIQYAGRVVQLARDLFGGDLEENFLKILEQAKSNIPEQGNGRSIYNNLIKPSMIDLNKVAAHYAISSLFEDYYDKNKVYCYYVDNEDYHITECGQSRLVTGRSRITSEITGETDVLSYGVFHFGGHVINAGVRSFQGEKEYRETMNELSRTCSIADFTQVMRLLDKYFGGASYSLKSLFRDEQRKVLDYILQSTMTDIERSYRQLYEQHYSPMRFLSELGGPVPRAFHSAAELIINMDLHRAVNRDTVDIESVRNLIETAGKWQIEVDGEGIGYDLKITLEKMTAAVAASPGDIESLKLLGEAITLARSLPFSVDLWKVQNFYWEIMGKDYPGFQEKATKGDEAAKEWVEAFAALGNDLSVRVGQG